MFNERTKSFSPTRRRTLLSRQSHVLKLTLLLLAILALTFCQTRLPTQHFLFSETPDKNTNTTSSAVPPPEHTTSSPTQSPRIAIITFTTSPQSYTHLSLRNHAAYARQHDYDFIVDYDVTNERDVMWGKFDMLRRVIDAGKHDWVWWMDFDTLITNMTTKVEDVVDSGLKAAVARGDVKVGGEDEIDWLVSEDWYVVVLVFHSCIPSPLTLPTSNGLNAGSFLVRAHPRSLDFLALIDSYYLAHEATSYSLSEQDCMRDVLFPPEAPSSAGHGGVSFSITYPKDDDEQEEFDSEGNLVEKTPAAVEVAKTRSEYAGRFALLPQRAINAFPPEIECYASSDNGVDSVGGVYGNSDSDVADNANGEDNDSNEISTSNSIGGSWQPGDFVVHFAGAWVYIHDDDPTGVLMQRYEHLVEWGPGWDEDGDVVVHFG